jgi:hypothetical protein
MKYCSHCKKEVSIDNFNKNKANSSGLQNFCRPCDNLKSKKRYLENPEEMKKQIYARRKRVVDENKKFVRSMKESVPCMDCKKSYPYYVMDFDHVRGNKDRDIAKLVQGSVSRQRLLDEIEKCEIVCSNCHRERTQQRIIK